MTDPVATRLAALAKANAGTLADVGSPTKTGAASFAQALEKVVGETITTNREAEAKALAGIGGEISLREVVEAVSAAEISLETTTAIRDRVISAYQEIMRMPI